MLFIILYDYIANQIAAFAVVLNFACLTLPCTSSPFLLECESHTGVIVVTEMERLLPLLAVNGNLGNQT